MDECTEYKSDGGGVLFASPTFQTPPEGGLFRKVTHAAGEAMCNCSNLQEVTIVLHDHCSLPTFTSFLSTLWTSLASSIRRLNMDVTLEKLQTLLLPLVMSPNVFLGLEELHIDIATSRFHISVDHKILIADLLLPFLNRLKSTLKSLALSSSEYLDLTPIFCGLEQFPALHSLEIFTTFSSLCLSEPSALTRVLQLHKQTLQQFSLTPRPRVSTTSRVTDSSYDRWLEQDLSKLVLPNLRKLEINQVPFIGYIRPFSVTVPDLRGFSTSLTSLTMVNYFLEIDGLNALCASLTSHPGRNCLETLRIDVQFLSSSIFDLLDAKLSRLEELDLRYAQMDVTVVSLDFFHLLCQNSLIVFISEFIFGPDGVAHISRVGSPDPQDIHVLLLWDGSLQPMVDGNRRRKYPIGQGT